jgi:hypothetical protein
LGKLIIARLRVDEQQSAIVAPDDAMVGNGKEVIQLCPLANEAGFDRKSFV